MRTRLAVLGAGLGLLAIAAPAQAAYVCRLNPYGDNFLSLRRAPTSASQEIMQLGPRTRLRVMRSSGGWLYVEVVEDGVVGWVASRYVCG